MDIATILGLLIALGAMIVAIFGGAVMDGETIDVGQAGAFWDLPSVSVVFGGSLAAVLVCFPLNKITGIFGVMKKCFFNTPENVANIINKGTDI